MTRTTILFTAVAMALLSFSGFLWARSPMGTAIRRGLPIPNRVTPTAGPRAQWLNVGNVSRVTPMVGWRSQWPTASSSVVGNTAAIGQPASPGLLLDGFGAAVAPTAPLNAVGFDAVPAPGAAAEPTVRSNSRLYSYSETNATMGGQVPPIAVATEVVSSLQQQLASRTPLPFSSQWYGNHPQVWRPAADAFHAWAAADWSAAAGWIGATPTPFYYDFAADGSGVIHAYRNGGSIGLAVYRRYEAKRIASADVKPAPSEKWLSLGVFALIAPEQSAADTLVQLSISSQGAVKGVLYDLLAGESQALQGSIDRSSQRAAWVAPTNAMVMETGLGNLTADASRLLVHKSDGWTQVWGLVRARVPEEATDKEQNPSE